MAASTEAPRAASHTLWDWPAPWPNAAWHEIAHWSHARWLGVCLGTGVAMFALCALTLVPQWIEMRTWHAQSEPAEPLEQSQAQAFIAAAEAPAWRAQLQRFALAHGLSIEQFAFNPAANHAGLEITLLGTYRALSAFVLEVAKAPKIILLRELRVQAVTGDAQLRLHATIVFPSADWPPPHVQAAALGAMPASFSGPLRDPFAWGQMRARAPSSAAANAGSAKPRAEPTPGAATASRWQIEAILHNQDGRHALIRRGSERHEVHSGERLTDGTLVLRVQEDGVELQPGGVGATLWLPLNP